MFGNIAEFSELKDGSDNRMEVFNHDLIEEPEEVIKFNNEASKQSKHLDQWSCDGNCMERDFLFDIIEGEMNDFQSRKVRVETGNHASISPEGGEWIGCDKVKKVVFEDSDSGGDQESNLGMSKLSTDHRFVRPLNNGCGVEMCP
ncbi:hypothetical protein HHK36_005862 [Tetracentron sinense]|uniref:Uncharacterized protein n=1 Tax=Tetracentron sinense TaxID=13715 RepID=A0A835DMM8_TETSI|nr:hypothetical protein HHK36_005862 [Tetracentron sinense]